MIKKKNPKPKTKRKGKWPRSDEEVRARLVRAKRERPNKKVTSQDHMIAAAYFIADGREELIQQVKLMMEFFESFSERLRTYESYLDVRDKGIEARMVFTHETSKALERLVDVLRENSIALNENTERLNDFLKKSESYFGDGKGLEYNN